MSGPKPQPSTTYTALHEAATSFILAQRHDPDHPRRMDTAHLTSLVSATYTHTFGHVYAVSRAPPLQGTFDISRFIAHLEGMLPNLENWDMDVTDVVVDEVKRKVVVRVSYLMRAKGAEEVVENDVLWVLEVDAEGKVATSEEIVDGIAAGRLKDIIMEKKA